VANYTLVIDGHDQEPFFLAVDSESLRVGRTPAHVEGTLRGMKVVRIHCEVEVEEDRDSVPIDQPGVIAPQVLRVGTPAHLAHSHLVLSAPRSVVAPPPIEPAAPPAPVPAATGPKRFRVIDGGDQGQIFRLPDTGTATIGKHGGPANIGLHDLYVMRVHCSIQVDHHTITVTHLDGQNGTLIDGQRINRPRGLEPGSVLRVGNSHLRLEVGPFVDETLTASEPEPVAGGSGVLRAPGKAPPPPAKSADPPVRTEAQVMGPYQLGPVLGRGHTGVVYKATHAKTGQVVALKVLSADFPASTAELEHLAQALKAIHHLRHPNLVTPLGAGRSGTHCWIAREFVEGESAASVIARIAEGDKPSWTRAARVAIHLARALDCLHQNQMVHGNITPHNVLLGTADHTTKLADLRLVQAVEGSQMYRAVQEKKLLAELPYLAPEQAEPGAFVDQLADLYAVGAVVYALITGRPPVTGDSPADILAEIHAGRVVRPGSYYKKVPAAFDGVVMKLLAHHQEDRYPTPAALLADLAPLTSSYDLKL
jgi:hypothetical protein